jgi:hypothetical protein
VEEIELFKTTDTHAAREIKETVEKAGKDSETSVERTS